MTTGMASLASCGSDSRDLDHADRRIRRYIHAKQKLIKLLEEQKQAIVHSAVTRGLEPNVRLKPSGVEWLGNIPENWKLMKLGQVRTDGLRNGISPPVAQDDTGVKSFSISAIRDGKLDLLPKDLKYVVLNDREKSTYTLRNGDILLVRGNGNIGLVGKAGLVSEDMPGFV
jgi:type I restriction enzyme S subunit